jgi:hypothetical protein
MTAENNNKHLSSGRAHPHEDDSIALGGDVVSTAALIEEQPETEEVSTALPSYGLSSVL